MRIILTTPTWTHTLALDFEKGQPPSRPVLWDWVKMFDGKMSTAELEGKLRLGTPFAFGGGVMSWQEG